MAYVAYSNSPIHVRETGGAARPRLWPGRTAPGQLVASRHGAPRQQLADAAARCLAAAGAVAPDCDRASRYPARHDLAAG